MIDSARNQYSDVRLAWRWKSHLAATIGLASSKTADASSPAPRPHLEASGRGAGHKLHHIVGCDRADIGIEEVGRVASYPVRPEMAEPLRFDVEGKDHGFRTRLIVRIGMRLPCIDQNCALVGERHEPVAHRKLRIGPLDLQQDMAMRMRVPHQGPIHIKQRHSPEAATYNAQGIRHRSNIDHFAETATPLRDLAQVKLA